MARGSGWPSKSALSNRATEDAADAMNVDVLLNRSHSVI